MHVRVRRQSSVFFIYLKYASYFVDAYTIPVETIQILLQFICSYPIKFFFFSFFE